MCLPDQHADDCGRGMARSFLRPPFMCAYDGSSSRVGRIVTPEPVACPELAGRPVSDSPLAACWPEGCLSMTALDVQGEEGELGACDGAGGPSELGGGGFCCAEEEGSRVTSGVWSSSSSLSCGASAGLLSEL